MSKTVLVTGGAGFIGSHLCEGLLARGYRVRVLDSLVYGRREWVPGAAEFQAGDIRDMGACAVLPRIIGQGRAAELLYTGRTMSAEEGERWGFYNRIVAPDELEAEAVKLAKQLAAGPTFGHMMTKTMLQQEWSMGIDQAIEAEAQAQAICMQTEDFRRAYEAFVAKQKPVFEGN